MNHIPNVTEQDRIAAIKAQHRALVILTVLYDEPSGMSNDAILADFLWELGMGSERGTIGSALEELAQLGALLLNKQNEVLRVQLTQKGDDLARGRARSDQVLFPRPGGPYEFLRRKQP